MARTSLYKDPLRCVKGLFRKEKSSSLKVPKRELEDHLKTMQTGIHRHEWWGDTFKHATNTSARAPVR